jgi:hypothetical protein
MVHRLLKIKTKTIRALPAGRCIYCGTTGVALTKEHAILLALGGRDIIPDASCERCRKITWQFETECLRGFLHDYRTASGFPTRRKKELRPSITQLRFDAHGVTQRIEVSAGEYPRYLVLPVYPLPGLLAGRERGAKVMFKTQLYVRETEARQLHRTIIRQTLKLHSFLRMIAKIGHSIAVARCDSRELATFKMLLPQTILSKDSSIYDLVGSDRDHSRPIPRVLHAFNFETVARDSTEFLVAGIQLFANMGTPRYLAIVGARAVTKN